MNGMQIDAGLGALIAAFEHNKEHVIRDVYATYRDSFLKFSRGICTDETVCIDSFQDAVIALYENLVGHKIKDEGTSVKTYLFAIGKYKILTELKKRKRLADISETLPPPIEVQSTDDIDKMKDLLHAAFDQLGPQCQSLLTKFYYHRYSIEAIMHDMDYKNENTVKANKSRCMSKLRAIFNP